MIMKKWNLLKPICQDSKYNTPVIYCQMTYLLEIRGGNGWEAVRIVLTSLTILSTSFGSIFPAAKSFSILDTICSAVAILMVVCTEVIFVVAERVFPVTNKS